MVVNNLTGKDDIMRYNAIPGVVYINPEIAGVGETEESARAKGIAYKVARLSIGLCRAFFRRKRRAVSDYARCLQVKNTAKSSVFTCWETRAVK